MFTGLVAAIGRVVDCRGGGSAPRRLTLQVPDSFPPQRVGDSVALDGCCLTVVACHDHTLAFEAATETLARTTLGAVEVGDALNLEPALRVGDALGGHWVSGHVDGVGTLLSRERRDSAVYLRLRAPACVLELCAPRGSIALAGVSLTVTDVDADTLSVAIIPHTLTATTLDSWQPGARANLEADLLARYAARLLRAAPRAAPHADRPSGAA